MNRLLPKVIPSHMFSRGRMQACCTRAPSRFSNSDRSERPIVPLHASVSRNLATRMLVEVSAVVVVGLASLALAFCFAVVLFKRKKKQKDVRPLLREKPGTGRC